MTKKHLVVSPQVFKEIGQLKEKKPNGTLESADDVLRRVLEISAKERKRR